MNRLRNIREKKGLTIGQLSARAGISARVINDYEIGAQLMPLPHAKLLAKALWVKVEDLLPPASAPAPPLSPPAMPLPSPRPLTAPGDVPAPPATPAYGEQAGGPAPRPGWASPHPNKPTKPTKPTKPKPEPLILPATEGQILEILRQGHRAGLAEEEIVSTVGKQLTELDRMQAREWIRQMRERATHLTEEAKRSPATTKLPDDREPDYLAAQMKAGSIFTFTMFDGQLFTGQIKDFTAYTIVIFGDDGNDVVLRKLAIAYYQKIGTGNPLALLSAAAQQNAHADTNIPTHKGELTPPHAPAAAAGLADDGEPGIYGGNEHSYRQEEDTRRDDVADVPSEEPLPSVAARTKRVRAKAAPPERHQPSIEENEGNAERAQAAPLAAEGEGTMEL